MACAGIKLTLVSRIMLHTRYEIVFSDPDHVLLHDPFADTLGMAILSGAWDYLYMSEVPPNKGWDADVAHMRGGHCLQPNASSDVRFDGNTGFYYINPRAAMTPSTASTRGHNASHVPAVHLFDDAYDLCQLQNVPASGGNSSNAAFASRAGLEFPETLYVKNLWTTGDQSAFWQVVRHRVNRSQPVAHVAQAPTHPPPGWHHAVAVAEPTQQQRTGEFTSGRHCESARAADDGSTLRYCCLDPRKYVSGPSEHSSTERVTFHATNVIGHNAKVALLAKYHAWFLDGASCRTTPQQLSRSSYLAELFHASLIG